MFFLFSPLAPVFPSQPKILRYHCQAVKPHLSSCNRPFQRVARHDLPSHLSSFQSVHPCFIWLDVRSGKMIDVIPR